MILTTKYSGPTNTRGSCVLVYCGASKARRVAWDHALDANENHAAAAAEVAMLVGFGAAPKGQIASHESYELPDVCNHSRVHIVKFHAEI